MFFFVAKLFQPLLWPTNLTTLLLAAMVLAFFLKRVRTARALGVAAFFVLWLPALPIVAHPLLRALENDYPVLRTSEAPRVDAIVVLGGTALGVVPPRVEAVESFGSRLFSSAKLFRAKKAEYIVVSSGGRYPLPAGGERIDAQDMRDYLIADGVPESAIVSEDRSRNTDENARFTAEILRERGWKKILLVTSAFHMPRSVTRFRSHGVTDIVPFPVDAIVTEGSPVRFASFLPDPGSLGLTTMSIKEYVGRFVYYLKGNL